MKSRADAYMPSLEAASERAKRYLRDVFERRVDVQQYAIARLQSLRRTLPEHGLDPVDVIKALDEFGAPATVPNMGGRFFGGVIGAALPASVAAHWIADAWDQNACLYEFSPVGAHLESVSLAWVLELLGLPKQSASVLVGGTQSAHVTALAAARHELLARLGWDVEADGLFDAPEIQVVVSEEAHATLLKALAILGLGRRRVLTVPTDAQGAMITTRIPRTEGPAIICAQVGNVNSGACDNIREICDVAERTDSWVHVDGAFGVWAAVSPRHRPLVDGLDLAASWATDAHKWLNTSYDCGIAIVRRAASLERSMRLHGEYYPLSETRLDAMMLGPDSSRRARGIELWASLCSLGKAGVVDLVERTCAYAREMAERLSGAGLEILNDVVLNQVIACYLDDTRTRRLIDGVRADGICWIGGTTWKGRYAMRISVSSWATGDEDIEKSAESIVRVAKSII